MEKRALVRRCGTQLLGSPSIDCREARSAAPSSELQSQESLSEQPEARKQLRKLLADDSDEPLVLPKEVVISWWSARC
mgnify:CR=1 FL=1